MSLTPHARLTLATDSSLCKNWGCDRHPATREEISLGSATNLARSNAPNGTCHICGTHGKLSFEHIPPARAFNNNKVQRVPFDEMIKIGPDDPLPHGTQEQRGAGAYTLCEKCNNNTGSWYGSAFVSLCYQASELLIKSELHPTLLYPYYIYPLRIIKQIVCMFLSVNRSGMQSTHQDLVGFVLNRYRSYLPDRYRFFLYYNVEGIIRHQNHMARFEFGSGRVVGFSEITYPPFGYVMTIDNDAPDRRLVEISHFANYGYDDLEMLQLRLEVLPTHLWVPGDYRSKDEIREAIASDVKQSSEESQAVV